MIEIKALACELPYQHELPLSRLSLADIREEAIRRGIVASIGRATIWRWLSEDAIRPWYRRSWIFPRDPDFAHKAGRVLDLYARTWEHKRLRSNDYVICADEKTSIQVRRRCHPSRRCRPYRRLRPSRFQQSHLHRPHSLGRRHHPSHYRIQTAQTRLQK